MIKAVEIPVELIPHDRAVWLCECCGQSGYGKVPGFSGEDPKYICCGRMMVPVIESLPEPDGPDGVTEVVDEFGEVVSKIYTVSGGSCP